MSQYGDANNSEPTRLRLLLVDDELDLLSTLSEILEAHGYAVVSTWEGEDAVEIASLYEPNIIVTDFRLPGIDGVTTIRRIKEAFPRVRAILVSGYISEATRDRASAEDVDEIFTKPVSIQELIHSIRTPH